MHRHLTYRILPEYRLVVEYFGGTFNMKDYLRLKKEQLNDKLFDPSFNIIGDLRDSEIIASNEDIQKSISFMFSFPKMLGNRRSAIITATPDQVVFSILFQKYGKDLPMHYEVVSTLDAAIKWVNCSPESITVIRNLLSELKIKYNVL